MMELPREHGWRSGPGVVALVTGMGIATGLGITRAAGCTHPPWTSAELNLLLPAVSCVLAGISVATPRPIAARLMALEFVCFLFFFLLLRGGYAVGYAGRPVPEVLLFDLVSASCR